MDPSGFLAAFNQGALVQGSSALPVPTLSPLRVPESFPLNSCEAFRFLLDRQLL